MGRWRMKLLCKLPLIITVSLLLTSLAISLVNASLMSRAIVGPEIGMMDH